MKDLKFKIICLMLVIPLLIIFATSSVVTATAILVDIPVSDVQLNVSNTSVDVGSTIAFGAEVLPLDATNKNWDFVLEQIDGAPFPEHTEPVYNEQTGDYSFVAYSNGAIKIVAMANGGKSDYAVVYVNEIPDMQIKPQTLTRVDSQYNLFVGQSKFLQVATDYVVFPSNSLYVAKWTTSNDSVVDVEEGLVKAVDIGVADITLEISYGTENSDDYVCLTTTFAFTVGVDWSQSTTGAVVCGGASKNLSENPDGTFGTNYVVYYDKTILDDNWTYQLPDNLSDKVDVVISDSVVSMENVGKKTITVITDKIDVNNGTYNGITDFAIKSSQSEICTLSFKYSDVLADIDEPIILIKDEADHYALYCYVGSRYKLSVVGVPDELKNCSVSYKISTDYNEIASVGVKDGNYTVNALNQGEAYVVAQFRNASRNVVYTTAPKRIDVVSPVTSLQTPLLETGYQREYVFGRYDLNSDGTLYPAQLQLHFSATVATTQGGARVYKSGIGLDELHSTMRVVYESSNVDAISVEQADNCMPILTFGEVSDMVSIACYLADNPSVKAVATINYRAKGINVKSDDDLMYINKGRSYNSVTGVSGDYDNRYANYGYETVLQKDIYLASKVAGMTDERDILHYLENVTTEISPTVDVQYYRNNNKTASIRYCMEIATDLYGNGHFISGQNITKATFTKNGQKVTLSQAIWNGESDFLDGPINLVKLNYYGADISVKSQDNIIFAVLKDNIDIANVDLRACDDDSLRDSDNQNSFDLTKLDKTGTVLDIIGNNCNVSYSKLYNGRSVVRVYGKAYNGNFNGSMVDSYRTNATFSNCNFCYGREFLVKIGSNQIEKTAFNAGQTDRDVLKQNLTDDMYNDASPLLSNASYSNVINNADNYQAGSDFYNNYVLTDVTVDNCIFEKAGLFCIGMDTMFGGLCLHGWNFSGWNFGLTSDQGGLGWNDISGTMYPSVLRLKGNTRFYDWKDISKVRSDSLVEVIKKGQDSASDILANFMNIDISQLVVNYATSDNANSDILYRSQGTQVDYVNGAVAFFGGGKNYSFVDDTELVNSITVGNNELSAKLNDYSVGVEMFVANKGVSVIYCSAGKEPFRFKLYDATCEFNYDKQVILVGGSGGKAYDILYKR